MRLNYLCGILAAVTFTACSSDAPLSPGPVSGPIKVGELRVDSAVSAIQLSTTAIDSIVAGDMTGGGHYYVSPVIHHSVMIVGLAPLSGTIIFKAFSSGGNVNASVVSGAGVTGRLVQKSATIVWR